MPDDRTSRIRSMLSAAIRTQTVRLRSLLVAEGRSIDDLHLTEREINGVERWFQSQSNEVSISESENDAESTELIASIAQQAGVSVAEMTRAMQSLANAGTQAADAARSFGVTLDNLRTERPGEVNEDTVLYRGVPIVPDNAMLDTVMMTHDTRLNDFRFTCTECGEEFINITLDRMTQRQRDPHVLQQEVGRLINQHLRSCSYGQSLASEESLYGSYGSDATSLPDADESVTYSRAANPELGNTTVHGEYDPYCHIKLPGMTLKRQRSINKMALRLIGKEPKQHVHEARCNDCDMVIQSFSTSLDDVISNETIRSIQKISETHSCLKAVYKRFGVRVIRLRA